MCLIFSFFKTTSDFAFFGPPWNGKDIKSSNLPHYREGGTKPRPLSKVTDEIYVSHPNQQDQGIKNTELMLFNDGSCYLQEGTQKEGYAVTTTT